MIAEITQNLVKQVCNCGYPNHVAYDKIRYDASKQSAKFVMPFCVGCKTRIEFIFLGTDMTREEMQLMVKMKQLGLMESK